MPNLIIVLLLLLALPLRISAQDASMKSLVSLGYMGQFGYQPGTKISARLAVKSWDSPKASNRTKHYFLSPQAGFFSWAQKHTGYLANLELGYQTTNTDKGKYSAFSIGLGYLLQSQITDLRINLNDGTQEKTRENWGWFLPSINYTFGKTITRNLGWYAKASGGLKLASTRATSPVVFTELGLTYQLQ